MHPISPNRTTFTVLGYLPVTTMRRKVPLSFKLPTDRPSVRTGKTAHPMSFRRRILQDEAMLRGIGGQNYITDALLDMVGRRGL